MKHPGKHEILTVEELSRQRFGNPRVIRDIEREAQEMRWALQGRSQFDGERLTDIQGGTSPDPEALQEHLAANEATLEEMRPPSDLTDVQQRKYKRLHDDLQAEFTQSMLTREQMYDPSDTNVEWNIAWQEHFARKAIAWMNIRQILDPQNDSPFFTSIESIRPTTPPKHDPRKIRENWALLRWTDETERLDIEIDEESFRQFLMYRAMDWSDTSIKKALGWTQAQFEATLDRFQDMQQTYREPPPDAETEDAHTTLAADTVIAEELQPTPARGAWLHEALTQRSIAQARFARELHLAMGTFANYLSGRHPFPDRLWVQAKALIGFFDDKPEAYAYLLRQSPFGGEAST